MVKLLMAKALSIKVLDEKASERFEYIINILLTNKRPINLKSKELMSAIIKDNEDINLGDYYNPLFTLFQHKPFLDSNVY